MCGTNEGVPQFFTVTDVFITHQRTTAVFAIDQSSKDIGTAAHIIKPTQPCLISIAPGLCKGLYYIKGLLVDDGLVSILDDFPFRLRREYLRCSGIEGLLFSSLHHMTEVNGML